MVKLATWLPHEHTSTSRTSEPTPPYSNPNATVSFIPHNHLTQFGFISFRSPATDFWQKARTFAEETAKRSQELIKEAAKRSQDLKIGSSKLSEIVSEASKQSKEIAAEAIKHPDQIKSQIPPAAVALSSLVDAAAETTVEPADLERFGVTDELREFFKGITLNTFREFPLQVTKFFQIYLICVSNTLTFCLEMSDIRIVSNVRQDLTSWQEQHAKLVLLTVKEISKLRYELCLRVMKEEKFWRIYFILVNGHMAPFRKD
ncbi:uncharacterized protein LOC130796642 [Actinidia eriantha]|uniref:uncharacterized protein LOC130796642 n=1 Tax=Actinidia eriantha TaxID=165200 RepID=UPI00258AB234|nr:uncharacterized protein LOC130796642 [Actinidia eriantha]